MPVNETTKLWATLHRRHKIICETLFPCPRDQVLGSGLLSVCKAFDIAFPVVLFKHERELFQFSGTSFTPRDFMEPFSYTSLCLEIFTEETPAQSALDHT